jgi:F-type H+-transporting ATPase subunit gamma
MAKGLPVLRRRIASVKATKKVTKAMQMIATTKLKVWKQLLLESSLYAKTLYDIIHQHLDDLSLKQAPYFHHGSSKNKLYIVVTSNLGLCGSYNYNVLAKLATILKPNDQVIIIGEKGSRFLKKAAVALDTQFVSIIPSSDQGLRQLSLVILQTFKQRAIYQIDLLYASFVNSLTFVPTIKTIFPIHPTQAVQSAKDSLTIIEPDPLTVMETLLPFYVRNILYASLVEAQVSEQSSRRNAMEKASDNADELVDQLQLDFNKLRQANITQEIAEIIGGSST